MPITELTQEQIGRLDDAARDVGACCARLGTAVAEAVRTLADRKARKEMERLYPLCAEMARRMRTLSEAAQAVYGALNH